MTQIDDIVFYVVVSVLGVCVALMLVFLYLCCKGNIIWRQRGQPYLEKKLINKCDPESRNSDSDRREMELKESLQRERQEKEELLDRLSRITSEKLRDGNPNIVDISDQNRPGKLGEQFSELYDNQWTDALEAIENQTGVAQRQAIHILLQILLECYEMSKKEAEDQIMLVRTQLESIIAQDSTGPKSAVNDILFRVKEERKLFAPNRVPQHEAVKQSLIANGKMDESILNTGAVQTFLQECERICWLMVVQDPPMVLFHSSNREYFREYLHRGKYLLYVVWPTVLLHEDGPTMWKGVAEYGDELDNQVGQAEEGYDESDLINL
ncbi:hypothetical protein ACF0H5_001654 [Mactra antiquata]